MFKVFERYANGSDLKIGLAIGQTDFGEEQTKLTFDSYEPFSKNFNRMQHALHPFSISNAIKAFGEDINDANEVTGCTWAESNMKRLPGFSIPNAGVSSIDVLVCTPGRLMDHLSFTPGFTLQHLRFLVIDEADRLVNQSYQNWIERVVAAASSGPEVIHSSLNNNNESTTHSVDYIQVDPVTWRRDVEKADEHSSNVYDFRSVIDTSACRPVQLRKLLFSATLTKDPKKLSTLGLVNPKQFDVHQFGSNNQVGYSLPDGLSEFMVECTAQQKPLVLLSFLLEQGLIDQTNDLDGIVVVFTSSKDSTHRLARLLQMLWVAGDYGSSLNVGEFSSALNQEQRTTLMKRCNENSNTDGTRVQVIICSDGMSRGMDIESVSAVINYDVPSFAKTYVHRCGRTARAGRKGRAITIMKSGQVSKFLKMRKLIGNPDSIQTIGIKKDLVKSVIPMYQKCIKAIQNVMNAESNNEIETDERLGPEWLV